MSATDELRKMLDERGVKHYDGTELTLWLKDEHGYRASADELTSGRLSVHIWCGTPEQAIDATLGTPRLPHWWTHDGTLYIDAPRMPTRIVVNEGGSCEFVPKREMDAENAKLREQIHWLKQGDILHVLTDQEYIDQCERERLMQVSIDALDKDNAKLRELVRWMYYRMDESCAVQHPYAPTPISYDHLMQALARARELGVEVDW